jgi:hypothetical protein
MIGESDNVASTAVKVAVAAPSVPVVPVVTAMPPPALAVNDTSTPEIRSFWALRARTVMVAELDPSRGMLLALVVAVSDVAATDVPPLLVPPLDVPPLDVPPLDVPMVPPLPARSALPPPQAASSSKLRQEMIDILRIALVPHRSRRCKKSVNI